MLTSLIFSAVLFTYFPVLIASFFIFDVLVRREYLLHRRDWMLDGQPHGIFWVPRELRSASGLLINPGSSLARRKAYGWLFTTPVWTKGDRTARRLLVGLRVLVFGWTAALVGVFAFAIFVRAKPNNSLDARGTSGLVIENLSLTWLFAAASTQPL
jgi:hypothetical protein